MNIQIPGGAAGVTAAYDFDQLIHEDRVHRSLYTDETIFQMEMTKIFGGVWTYLAHESQIPENNNFSRDETRLAADYSGARFQTASSGRCTIVAPIAARRFVDRKKERRVPLRAPITAGVISTRAKLSGVPWSDGYACDFSDARYNLAQVPRIAVYRGFIFGTLNLDMPLLEDYLGPVRQPFDEWLDRHPGGDIAYCDANRYKFKGNWKLLYDNSCDGYHVIFSHRSLLAMENRFVKGNEAEKGMAFYKNNPDLGPVHLKYFGNGHHFKDKRMTVPKRPGALWEIEGPHPGMEHYEQHLRQKLGDKADAVLDLASSEPVNINIFPNLHILGNHVQVTQPISVTETDSTWWGTAVVDKNNELHGEVDAINALRMRTQEQFPNFGEVDDLMNFEEIQVGLAALEDEWVLYASRYGHTRALQRRRCGRADWASNR